MKLTESNNVCYISNRVARTIIVNIKATDMEIDGILQMFMWCMDCSQRIKDLLLDKFSI